MNESEEIKERLPIEQVVGKYLPLKKAGRIYKANCPFHNEKTPSFTVNPERGIFKCFGCNEGGDIFDFVMKIEGLTFPESLKLLAEQAGVVMESHSSQNQANEGPARARLLHLNTYVSKLWYTILSQHPKAQDARDYLTGRGLTPETITTFQIGYAPLGNTTTTTLTKAGFTGPEIRAAGDPAKFQDRIVFPISDITGRVVGFTGRLLELANDPSKGANRGPKYWNTPDTTLFNKSKIVYGLHLAKHAIQSENLAVLVEGQMDVVMLHQAGYQNTIASSGTALTSQQLQLLGRFTTTIAFAYDQDNAGIEATKRGIELVLAAELNPFIIVVPSGKDPAECLQKDPEAWKAAYEQPLPFMEWLIDQALPGGTELSPIDKKEAAKKILPWLARIQDPIEQAEWILLAAARLQTEEIHLKTALNRQASPRPKKASTVVTPPPTKAKRAEASSPLERAELAVALLFSFPGILSTVKSQIADLRLAGSSEFLNLTIPILEQKPDPLSLDGHLKQQLSEEEVKNLYLQVEEILRPYNEMELDVSQALAEFMLIAQRTRSEAKEGAKSRLAREIQQAQLTGNQAKLQELFAELKNLL